MAPPDDATAPPVIVARHRGWCPLCRGTIFEGNDSEAPDEIVKYRGVWIHAVCMPDLGDEAAA